MANLTYSHPRNYLNMCRRCFRERANDIGFIKVRLKAAGDEVEVMDGFDDTLDWPMLLWLLCICSTGKLLLVGQTARWTTGMRARDKACSLTLKPVLRVQWNEVV